MKSLRFTIYEILGYVAPGLVCLAALCLIVWAAFWPQTPLAIARYTTGKEEIALVLFAAYTLGHFVQGISNLHPNAEISVKKDQKHRALIEQARLSLARRCKIDTYSYSITQLVSLSQGLLLHSGKTDDHEVFLYREGFYRGSSLSYVLLTVSLFVRALRHPTAIIVAGSRIDLTFHFFIFAIVLSSAVSFVFYQRYRRFGRYLILNLLHCACLPEQTSKKEDKAADKDGSASENATKDDDQEESE
jgi:hypothetical protein